MLGPQRPREQHERLGRAGREQHLARSPPVPPRDRRDRRPLVRVRRDVRRPDQRGEPGRRPARAHVDGQVDQPGNRLSGVGPGPTAPGDSAAAVALPLPDSGRAHTGLRWKDGHDATCSQTVRCPAWTVREKSRSSIERSRGSPHPRLERRVGGTAPSCFAAGVRLTRSSGTIASGVGTASAGRQAVRGIRPISCPDSADPAEEPALPG